MGFARWRFLVSSCLSQAGEAISNQEQGTRNQLGDDAARDLQEDVFQIGFDSGEAEDAHASVNQVFEQLVNLIGLAGVFGMNGAPVAGRALDLRSL